MKIAGIITEYNPFHNGHFLHMEETRRLTGADYVVAIMSGNFVQRGIPAFSDKYMRTQMALASGVDLVIELPVCYACASAEYFASGAIALLDKLDIIDSICFGSECGDIELLSATADLLLNEPPEYQAKLRDFLKRGMSFPSARLQALSSFTEGDDSITKVLQSPNNILGIEYIKALKKRGSSIKPYTNLRTGSGYLDENLTNRYGSALAIRKSIKENYDLDLIKNQIPSSVFPYFASFFQKNYPVYEDDFSLLLQYKLLLNESAGYSDFFDVTEDLSHRISNNLNRYSSFSGFCEMLKTKDITHSRISRSLLHILLDLTSDDINMFVSQDYLNYARILGFRDSSSSILSRIKKESSIPLLSKTADASQILSVSALKMLDLEIKASHIYDSVVSSKFNKPYQNEYTRPVIRY